MQSLGLSKKSSGIHVIDMKRAHNISIQLSSLRKPFLELSKALQEVDEGMLTTEALSVLLRTLPTKEDISNLKEYKGDPLQLAEVERYYLEIMLIPRVDKKIRVLNFKSQSSHLIQQIKDDLLLLQSACEQLKESERFVKLLEAVLAVGNYLNGDSCRGHAKGFKLDALLKLSDIKGSNRQTTLLHFVVVELVKLDAQILYLPDELKNVKAAASLKLENIMAGIIELERGLHITDEEIEFAKSDLSNTCTLRSKFLESMVPFYEDCLTYVTELKELLNGALQRLKHVSEYFGESGAEQPAKQMDLFHTMHRFLTMFHQVSKEIQEGRSSLKFDQRNDVAQFPKKTKCSYDDKATAKVRKDSINNKEATIVRKDNIDSNLKNNEPECSSSLNVSSNTPETLMVENQRCKHPISTPSEERDSLTSDCIDERRDQEQLSPIQGGATGECIQEALLGELSSRGLVNNSSNYLGYDSDWSTC